MSKNKTVRQFAADQGVHPNTVYHWIRMGMMPCLKLGGVIRIRPCDEEALFSRCEYDAGVSGGPEVNDNFMPTPRSKDAYEMGVTV